VASAAQLSKLQLQLALLQERINSKVSRPCSKDGRGAFKAHRGKSRLNNARTMLLLLLCMADDML
jgi:hypothetical protein